MDPKPKFPVPAGFKNLVDTALKANPDLSLREVARRAGLSASFLVRILAGDRGLPEDALLLSLARTLHIEPPEKLLIEAGRIPASKQKILLRTVSTLNEAEMAQVLKFAKKLEGRSKRP